MTNREQRMDEFIKMIAYDYQMNPSVYRTSRPIYTFLTHNDLPKEDANKRIDDIFQKWIERYKYNLNIEVKNTDDWKYFCQFYNRNNVLNIRNSEQIKIYVPLDSKHMYEGANMIFDYLASQDMIHESKIGSHVRVDDVVIRVFDKRDAIKVQNFIKNNKYIREGLMECNPFVASDGLISFASDGLLSYNSEVCELIFEYVKVLKEANQMNTASLADFRNFVSAKLAGYSTRDGFEELAKAHNKDKHKILSAYNVLNLISKNLSGRTTEQDLYNHYEKISNPKFREAQLNNIVNAMNTDIEYKKKMLFIAVVETAKKYNETQARNALCDYYYKNDSNGFTSTNGARTSIESLNIQDIQKIYMSIYGKEISLPDGLYTIVSDIVYKFTDNRVTERLEGFSNELEDACFETYKKHGEEFTIGAIRQVLKKGSYNGFTRTNGARVKLQNSMTAKQIFNTMISSLGSVPSNDIDFISATYFDYVKGKYALQR